MQNVENNSISRLQFSQWWLFFIRALIVCLVVFLLVQPVLLVDKKATNKTLVMVEHSLRGIVAVEEKIDALAKSGFTVRQLADEEALQNYWSVLKSLERDESSPEKLIFISSGKLRNFQGTRPASAIETEWVIVPDDTVRKSIAGVRRTANDSLLILSVASTASVTTLKERRISMRSAVFQSEYATFSQGQELFLVNRLSDDTVVVEDQWQSKVGIYKDTTFAGNAQYLEAAIVAVEKYLQANFEIYYLENDKLPDEANYDLVCWLSAKPLPASIGQSGTHYLVYRPSAMADDSPWWVRHQEDPYQYIWHKPLDARLMMKPMELPAALLEMIARKKWPDPDASLYDKRAISFQQMQPGKIESKSGERDVEKAVVALEFYIWVLVFLLFLIERLLSERSKTWRS